jgi:murein DD-endopeptidase MepM/ murein hydrolase activator NlpD
VAKSRFSLRRKGGRPVRSSYTVLILPHSRSRFRKLHVSRAFVLSTGAALFLLLGAGLYAPHLLLKLRTQSLQLEELSARNEHLQQTNEQFENRLAAVSDRLNRFEDTAGRLATKLGVEESALTQPAAGGPALNAPSRSDRASVFGEELGALNSRSDRLDGSLEELDRAFQDRARLLAATPTSMPSEGWFSHGYGWRKDPFTGQRQFHRGIDIVSHTGTPIRATADGIVSRATRVSDYGKTLDISHGFGYVTRYAHLSEVLVRPGQKVRRGDLVGRMGSTGRSTGPHLHYEVFRDGRRVNPWKYLNER